VGITEHDLSTTKKVIVLVNYNPFDKSVALNIKPGWQDSKTDKKAIKVNQKN